ncbi:MAG: hypothetical protein M3R55_00370 [Acidobacteriota bacterium]|nr:hypothetical protein [Acidobacteriota bacterium]
MSKWTPQEDQTALTLAAIRWYAISIEKLSADLYITNKTLYPEVQAILNTCFRDLGAVRKSLLPPAGDEGCGPGYVNCHGVCLPDCDNFNAY